MSYCAVTDIYEVGTPNAKGRLAKLAEEIDTADIQGYIDGADAIIDAKLASKFVVPFVTPIPKLIKEISLRLACCQIIMINQENYADDKVTDPMLMCQEAKQWLEDLAEGKLAIDAEIPEEEGEVSLEKGGLSIVNRPINGADETETNRDKLSNFYLPNTEHPPMGS